MGFKVLREDTPQAGLLLDLLLPDPDRLWETAEIFKPGTRTYAGRVELGGNSYFLKRFNDRGLWYRLRHLVKMSRAERTWMVNLEFHRHRLPVPKPLLCLIERRFLLLRRSYLLTEFAEDTLRLREAWPRLEARQRERLLEQIGGLLGRMHSLGCLHGDFKWDNILVRNDGTELQVTVVDLDGSRIYTRLPRKKAEKDLNRFLRDLKKVDEAGLTWDFFRNAWMKWTVRL